MEISYIPTIVLVDDEAQLLDLYQMRMKSLTCHFLKFTKPEDFITYLQQNPHFSPDILITDYKMPGMTGIEMVQSAQALIGNFPTVLLSGYIDHEKAAAAKEHGISHILDKPSEKAQFLALIRLLLSQGPNQKNWNVS